MKEIRAYAQNTRKLGRFHMCLLPAQVVVFCPGEIHDDRPQGNNQAAVKEKGKLRNVIKLSFHSVLQISKQTFRFHKQSSTTF